MEAAAEGHEIIVQLFLQHVSTSTDTYYYVMRKFLEVSDEEK